MINTDTLSFKLTTLTPIHIGSGRELQGNFDYLYFPLEKSVALLDQKKVFDQVGEEALDHWVNLLDKKGDLGAYLHKRNPKLKISDVALRAIQVGPQVPKSVNRIKEFVHFGTHIAPMIPGSSIKGAVRTALFNKLLIANPAFARSEPNLKNYFRRLSDRSIQVHYLAPDADGREKDQPYFDLFRLLRIRDVAFPQGSTSVLQNTVVNKTHRGWGLDSNLGQFIEILPEGNTQTGTLQIPSNLIKAVVKERHITENIDELKNLDVLCATINNHTLRVINFELDFWKEQDDYPEEVDWYVEALEEIALNCESAANQRSFVLRLGGHTGWDSMTGGWAKESDIIEDMTWEEIVLEARRGKRRDINPFPKTRKLLAADGRPLGFIKIELLYNDVY